MTADAHHITAPHPEGLGAKSVMKQAIEEAGIKENKVDYINVHGTSTPLGDIAETKAIKNLFGEHSYKLNISSTKSMTGHLLNRWRYRSNCLYNGSKKRHCSTYN